MKIKRKNNKFYLPDLICVSETFWNKEKLPFALIMHVKLEIKFKKWKLKEKKFYLPDSICVSETF